MEIRTDEPLPFSDEMPADDTQPSTFDSDAKLCQVCGLPIERQPGRRRGKYHDQCRPQGAPQRSSGGRATNVDTLIDGIEQLHIATGAGFSFVPPIAMDGMVITANARQLAESWRPLILKDPAIRKFWERATTGSGWGKVVIAYGMVGMAIASNHGVHLPGMSGQAVPQS
jgi:hypothetical protein